MTSWLGRLGAQGLGGRDLPVVRVATWWTTVGGRGRFMAQSVRPDLWGPGWAVYIESDNAPTLQLAHWRRVDDFEVVSRYATGVATRYGQPGVLEAAMAAGADIQAWNGGAWLTGWTEVT